MTDDAIIRALIARDRQVTEQFFFKDCRPLFMSVINAVFNYEVEYDEFVNEFYLHLMENDAKRLRQFQGRSSIYLWLKIVAIRYFIAKRNRVIEDVSKDNLLDSLAQTKIIDVERTLQAKMDMKALFDVMSNKRYVYAIQRLVLDDAEPLKVAEEMKVSVDNLYNIKRRAIAALTEVALNTNK